MRKTTQKEIDVVSRRLDIFEGNIKPSLVTRLNTVTERGKQHRLFWLLLDDKMYLPFKHAIEVFKKYGSSSYLNRALRKSCEANDPVQYSAAIAELIAVAYYIEKFEYEKGKVLWERRVSKKGNSVDISINYQGSYINIEVTGLTESLSIREYWEESYMFRESLRDLIIDEVKPKYGYFITFPGDSFLDLKNVDFLRDFRKNHITALADFITEQKDKGQGDYIFHVNGKALIEVKIMKLETSSAEYVENGIGWSGEMNESQRIRSKVIEKATRQLPMEELNFVYLPNLGMLDKIDYEDAMWGQSAVTFDPNRVDNVHQFTHLDNGISRAILDFKLAPVGAIIMGKLDYFNHDDKYIVTNPRNIPPDDVLVLIS